MQFDHFGIFFYNFASDILFTASYFNIFCILLGKLYLSTLIHSNCILKVWYSKMRPMLITHLLSCALSTSIYRSAKRELQAPRDLATHLTLIRNV